jgi:predicted dehydrogenase
MAECHALALAMYPYYYPDAARLRRVAVASARPANGAAFADRFGFDEAIDPDRLWGRDDVEAVILAGPNDVHCEHLVAALNMPSVSRIYLEKPVCAGRQEEEHLCRLVAGQPVPRVVQVGFQFLQMGVVRHALRLSKQGLVGSPLHFQARYLHGGYLRSDYREKRRSRLRPAPGGGAIADLGSHALSLLVAFLGEELEVVAARSSGSFPDVPAGSDLCTTALLREPRSGAVGTVMASRISAGAGDVLEIEVRGSDGAFRLSTERPDVLEFYDARAHSWKLTVCGNDYEPMSIFPARQVPAGWLRPLVHAQYLFFGGTDPDAFVPDLGHGLAVQRLVRQVTEEAGLVSEG